MRIIVTDKLARRQGNVRAMIQIEMPCCGTTVHMNALDDEVRCETCGVALELADPDPKALPVAA